MLCPRCGSDQHCVKDSRISEKFIRRRRACGACDNRFTTFEMAVPDAVHAQRASASIKNASHWQASVLGRLTEIESILQKIKESV